MHSCNLVALNPSHVANSIEVISKTHVIMNPSFTLETMHINMYVVIIQDLASLKLVGGKTLRAASKML